MASESPELTASAAAAIDAAADAEDARFLQRFFKTGPGQYGEGDVFVGVRVPATRTIVRRFERMPLAEARALLDELAASDSLWERRVAVLATFAFIKAGDGTRILRLAPRLLEDREDLMHKAVGWMMRELGERVARAYSPDSSMSTPRACRERC